MRKTKLHIVGLTALTTFLSAACGPTQTDGAYSLYPPDFTSGSSHAIFTDITSETVNLTMDIAAQTANVHATMRINIEQPDGGSPVIDLVPTQATTVTVDNGQPVILETVKSPDGLTTFRMVGGAALSAGPHTLAFSYALTPGGEVDNTPAQGLTWGTGTFDFTTNQDDLLDRGFTERYFPAGVEAQRYPMTINVDVENAALGQANVVTGGTITTNADGHSYTITYPDYDATSSWFFEVLDTTRYKFGSGTYTSVDGRSIPIATTALTQSDADLMVSDAQGFLAELEGDYGPFPHDHLQVAYTDQNDPEEYDSCVQTDFNSQKTTPVARGALGHEILHQWFGRSARPHGGRDGWVDEAIAEWRDDGYPRAKSVDLMSMYKVLAYDSKYERTTPDASYDQGSSMLSMLDFLFANSGGMKPVLKAFQAQFKGQLYTTEDFLSFVKQQHPDQAAQLDTIFTKMVYGK